MACRAAGKRGCGATISIESAAAAALSLLSLLSRTLLVLAAAAVGCRGAGMQYISAPSGGEPPSHDLGTSSCCERSPRLHRHRAVYNEEESIHALNAAIVAALEPSGIDLRWSSSMTAAGSDPGRCNGLTRRAGRAS